MAQGHSRSFLLSPRITESRRGFVLCRPWSTNVRSMSGGIDAWSLQVDPLVPRYEVVRDSYSGGAALRPLQAVVSQATSSQE